MRLGRSEGTVDTLNELVYPSERDGSANVQRTMLEYPATERLRRELTT